MKLRNIHGIDSDCFVIGFVFRNQLRKSAPNLLDGFKIFLKENPQSKAKLLLHTNWSEGWDLTRLIKEKKHRSISNFNYLFLLNLQVLFGKEFYWTKPKM